MSGPSSPESQVGRLRRVPALDGIRAIAITGVVAYHLGFSEAGGGFLGVDTFFALSGFLITSLLVEEALRCRPPGSPDPGRSPSGPALRLGAFWGRRARRLLPALFAMLVAVIAYVGIENLGSTFPTLQGDGLATLFYFANWHDIATQTNYFALSAHPSPLLHTWSLSIEEQFYVVWPLLLVVFFARKGATRRRLVVLIALCLMAAGLSAWWMVHLDSGPAGATGAYYSTLARAQSLLVGAALAFAVAAFRRENPHEGRPSLRPVGYRAPFPSETIARARPFRSRNLNAAGTLLGLAGLGGTAWAFHSLSQSSSFTFFGGFALVACSAVAVIASVSLAPRSFVTRALGFRPFAYLGRISYGVYLWHWPVVVFMTHARTDLTGWYLAIARVAVMLAVSVVSFHLVEMPIRRGALRGGAKRPWAPELPALGAGVACCLVAILAITGGAPATEPAARRPKVLSPGQEKALGYLDQVAALKADTRVLMVGDSMALTLGMGMADAAPSDHVWLADQAIVSCSVSLEGPYVIEVTEFQPPPECGSNTTSAENWRALWKKWIDQFDPDVVVYLARNDLANQLHDGSMEHVGESSFDSYLTANLQQAVSIMSSRGAKVVLLTTPYYDSGEQPSGNPWPEDDPSRVSAYNSILRQVAAADPSVVSIFDLNALTCPGGHFDQSIDGIQIRASDGVHFTEAGGQWVAPKLLPFLYGLGRAHHATTPMGTAPGPVPPS